MESPTDPPQLPTDPEAPTWCDETLHLKNARGVAPDAPFDLGPRYQLMGKLGEGGMGVVYRVRDLDLDREVALKLLSDPDLKHSIRAWQRFVGEVRIAGQLQHPAIVPVYDTGVTSDGVPWFSMRLIGGDTLRDLLLRKGPSQESELRLLGILQRVAEAVAYAHERSVLHRDLKPANIMVGEFGDVQVLDWGLAKVLGPDASDEANPSEPEAPLRPPPAVTDHSASRIHFQSVVGTVIGTPSYMAPEQAQGATQLATAASDVFALGAMLCEVLTGKPPYADLAEHPRTAARHGRLQLAHQRLVALETPGKAPLLSLVRSCLMAEADDRLDSARELAEGLRDWIADQASQAHDAEVLAAKARTRRATERRFQRRIQLLALAAVLVVLAGAWIWGRQFQADARTIQRTEQVIGRELGAAESMAAEASSVPTETSEGLIQKVAMLREAQSRLEKARVASGTGPVGQRLQQRQDVTTQALSDQQQQAEAELKARQLDAQVLRKLTRLVPNHSVDPSVFVTGLREAVQALGIRFEDVDADVLRLQPRYEVAEIATALEAWAYVLPKEEYPDQALWGHVAQVIERLPVADSRAELRAALNREDLVELRRMAAAPASLDYPARILGILCYRLQSLGAVDAAIDLGRRVLAKRPNASASHVFMAAREMGRSRDPQDLEMALLHLRAALASAPDSIRLRLVFAGLLRRLGRRDEAGLWEQEVRSQAPHEAELIVSKCRQLQAEGKVEEAMAEIRRAQALKPQDPMLRVLEGDFLFALRKEAKARAIWKQVLIDRPRFRPALRRLAGAVISSAAQAEALGYGRELLKIAPDDLEGLCHVGNGLFAGGRHSEARAYLLAAVKRLPEQAGLHYALGMGALQLGRMEETVNRLQQCLSKGRLEPSARRVAKRRLREANKLIPVYAGMNAVLEGADGPEESQQWLTWFTELGSKRLWGRAAQLLIECERQGHDCGFPDPGAMLLALHVRAATGAAQDVQTTDGRVRASQAARKLLLKRIVSLEQATALGDNSLKGSLLKAFTTAVEQQFVEGLSSAKGRGALPKPERQPWQELWERGATAGMRAGQ